MVGNLNNMSAIRQKRLSYCYNGAEVLSTKKHNASHLSVWNVQCAPGMFSYAGRCYSKQISARRCMTEEKKKEKKSPFGTNDGNERNWKQITSLSGPRQLDQRRQTHTNGYFLVDVEPVRCSGEAPSICSSSAISAWCRVRNLRFSPASQISRPRGGWFLLPPKYEDWSILWCVERCSLTVNGLEGDWKMAFICHTTQSDSNSSISLTTLAPVTSLRNDRGFPHGCGRNDIKGSYIFRRAAFIKETPALS